MPKKVNFQTSPRSFAKPIWGRFGRPKSTKMEPKTSPNLRRFSRAKKLLFKSLLEPSWADLGAFWRPSWGPKKHFRIGKTNTGAKSTFFMKTSVQEAFWCELGAIWAPKRAQKGGQKGPKRHQKRDQNDIKILIDFWIDFWTILEAPGDLDREPRGLRGAWLSSLISKNSKTISKTVQSRSNPSGGGGFNRAARSPPGRLRKSRRGMA